MSQIHVLMIGYVWPEPTSSAAGLREVNCIEAIRSAGWKVSYASPSKDNPYREKLIEMGIETFSVQANDLGFDSWIQNLCPDFVIFDRFVIEEQFGWRVYEHSPETIRVLDTQDLHFLRRARQQALEDGASLNTIADCSIQITTEDTWREIASIYRSDLALLLSDFEMNLLKTRYDVPEQRLNLARLSYSPHPGASSEKSFDQRQHFAVIGNFRHPPNYDGVFWLHKEIWPLIRAALPQAEVHLYGAYPPKEIMNLNQPRNGFHVKGWTPDQFEMLSQYRVNLAPLRFGAGNKGKILDGWWSGTPVVTTPVGAEGMNEGLPWGGLIAENVDAFVQAAVKLYQTQNLWTQSQTNGRHILSELFDSRKNADKLISTLTNLREGIKTSREKNHVGQMLWHQSLRSTKYFSKWIEAKNRPKTEPTGSLKNQ